MFVRPDRCACGERAALVLGIGIGVDEDDGDGLRARSRSSSPPRLHRGRIDRRADACRRRACARSTSRRMSRSAIGMKSPHSPQVCGRSRRRISSTSRKPRVVMTPIARPAPLQQRVGADRRAVHDRTGAAIAAERVAGLAESPPPRRRDATAPWRCGSCRAAASNQNRSVNVPPTSTPTMDAVGRSCAAARAQRAVARHVDDCRHRGARPRNRGARPARET